MKGTLFTDGGARGNPGPAALGIVLKSEDGSVNLEMGKFVGNSTNNEAEYLALLEGVNAALQRKVTDLTCYLDSELVVNQMKGEYKIKNARLKKYFDKLKILENQMEKISYVHVPRTKNQEADALVNKTLDHALGSL